MTVLLAVDGNSLAHRAYHATAEEGRTGAFMTGSVVRMLATTWAEGPFDGVLVAFDDPAHNVRKVDHPEYKAHRDEKDDLLCERLAELPGNLEACGFTVATSPGAEADDLLAAAADACIELGWECAVLSSDRDLLALVSESVRLLRPLGSMSNLRVYDEAAVLAEFGVRADQYTDFAALRGDPSDGLDGVHGVGPKTAARLLRDYGDVPGIYASLTSLPPRLEAALRAGRENVDRNLMLMAPLPRLEVDVRGAVADGIDLDLVTGALNGLGEGAAAGIFSHAFNRPPLPPMPPPPEEDAAPAPAIPPAVAERREAVTLPVGGQQVSLF